jgi:hypothetical protein
MEYDRTRVIENARQATTEDLLNRVTVYRSGLEPEAIDIIEAELYRRGYKHVAIEAHAAQHRAVLTAEDGVAIRCSRCHHPAVETRWGWHWLTLMIWGKRRPLLPVFPRRYYYCEEHRPAAREAAES